MAKLDEIGRVLFHDRLIFGVHLFVSVSVQAMRIRFFKVNGNTKQHSPHFQVLLTAD